MPGYAFITKYVGWTNSKPNRVSAVTSTKNPSTDKRERMIQSWNHDLDTPENHIHVALELAAKAYGLSPEEVKRRGYKLNYFDNDAGYIVTLSPH